VWASTRGARIGTLREAGLLPVVLDVVEPFTTTLPAVDTVLFAVGLDRSGGVSMHDIHERGLARTLEALPSSVHHLIYVSTTGVYGYDDGRWVDERSPCEPSREGGRACLAGETRLRHHARIPRRTVLRLAGLYGPGRLPHSAAVLAGATIRGSSDAFLNLVHVDDAARAVVAAADGPGPRGTICYLVSDGAPLTRGAYVELVASHLKAATPTCAGGAGLGKRVRNARMRDGLGVAPRYASVSEGLASVPAQSVNTAVPGAQGRSGRIADGPVD